MPNRIIKDSIAKSEKVNALNDFQFRLWVHLITYVDDFGRGDARPAVIKGTCFPFRDRLTNKDIEKGLADLAGAGCVGLYTVDGKPYLYFPNWEQHQRVRSKISKCPAPEEGSANCQVAASCGELPQNAPVIQNPESGIQNTESRTIARAREEDFARFWAAYPRKEGKQTAISAFKKVTAPVEILLSAIEEQKKSHQWQKDNGQFIPHPATWLNGKRWEDQITTEQPSQGRQLDEDDKLAIQRMLNGDYDTW